MKKKVCTTELNTLKQWDVYKLVDVLKGHNVVNNCWVFDDKPDGRKCAHLIVKGCSQVKGIDFDQVFSPVVRFETMHLMLALTSIEKWNIEGIDVHSTYLYGKLDEEIYMKQPKGFVVKGQEHKVLHLKCALYNLKQARLAVMITSFSLQLMSLLSFPLVFFLLSCFFPFLWNAFCLNTASLLTHCTGLCITLLFILRDYPFFAWTLFLFLCAHSSLLFLNWHSLVCA